MHKKTKLTPVIRKEVFEKWKTGSYSQRELARQYHVDKRVIGRLIVRGENGDFEVHDSVNHRYLKNKRSDDVSSRNSGTNMGTATTNKHRSPTAKHVGKRSTANVKSHKER